MNEPISGLPELVNLEPPKEFDLSRPRLDGSNLIEASAGTGKTYTIVALVVYLLIEKNIDISQILVVTYTEAATRELRERIRFRLRQILDVFDQIMAGAKTETDFIDDLLITTLAKKYRQSNELRQAARRIQTALRLFDEAAIYTIHGFCRRMLAENAFESQMRFNMQLVTDNSQAVADCVADFWRTNFYPLTIQQLDGLLSIDNPKGIDYASLVVLTTKIPLGLKSDYVIKPKIDYLDEEFLRNRQRYEKKLAEKEASVLMRIAARTEKIKPIWSLEKENVYAILKQYIDDGLFKANTIHKKKDLRQSMEDIKDLLDSNPKSIRPLKMLEYFLPDKLNKSLKQKAIPIEKHPLLVQLYKLSKIYQKYEDIKENNNRHGKKIIEEYEKKIKAIKIKFVSQITRNLDDYMSRRNSLTFNDLLLKMAQAVVTPTSAMAQRMRQRFRAVLIDEFQDTDPVQYSIFNKCFGDRGDDESVFYMIGDPKQSIYSFRNADIYTYLAAKSYPGLNQFSLQNNYRSDPALIQAVNILFQIHPNPFKEEKIQYHQIKSGKSDHTAGLWLKGQKASAMRIWLASEDFIASDKDYIQADSARELAASQCAVEIAQMLKLSDIGEAYLINDDERERIKPKHIAVLVRKHNEGELILEQLGKLQIPAARSGSGNIYKSAEAADLRKILVAVVEPNNINKIRTAMGTHIYGKKASEIFDESLSDGLGKYIEKFNQYRDIWNKQGFPSMMQTVLTQNQVKERLLRLKDGERRVTNLLHLLEILQRMQIQLDNDMNKLLRWFCNEPTDEDSLTEKELRLETDADAVKIITMHSSKGLEFPIVFCPFLWTKSPNIKSNEPIVYHDKEDKIVLDLDGSQSAEKSLYEQEILAEDIRLFYVAVTRAKHQCNIFWAKIYNGEKSAGHYVLYGGNEKKSINQMLNQLLELEKHCNCGLDDSNQLAMEIKYMRQENLLPEIINKASLNLDAKKDIHENVFCPDWQRDLGIVKMISSYSGLSHGSYQHRRRDNYSNLNPGFEEASESEIGLKKGDKNTLHDFPKGPISGLCFHKILESIDYQTIDNDSLIDQCRYWLTWYGFDATKWEKKIADALMIVFQKELQPGLRLLDCPATACIKEMAFYFPLHKISASELARILAIKEGDLPEEFIKAMAKLSFKDIQGYLNGFIDLVFKHDERYYILDWKSNYLGPDYQSYDRNHLTRSCAEHHYYLQFLLYSVALHRFLKFRLGDRYRYDKHFGGVYYLFLRGINADDNDHGIYGYRPKKVLIEKISIYFAGLEGNN